MNSSPTKWPSDAAMLCPARGTLWPGRPRQARCARASRSAELGGGGLLDADSARGTRGGTRTSPSRRRRGEWLVARAPSSLHLWSGLTKNSVTSGAIGWFVSGRAFHLSGSPLSRAGVHSHQSEQQQSHAPKSAAKIVHPMLSPSP